jgi:hypothetical protein
MKKSGKLMNESEVTINQKQTAASADFLYLNDMTWNSLAAPVKIGTLERPCNSEEVYCNNFS